MVSTIERRVSTSISAFGLDTNVPPTATASPTRWYFVLVIASTEPRKRRTDPTGPRREDGIIVDNDVGRECNVGNLALQILRFAMRLVVVDQCDDALVDCRRLVFHEILEERHEAEAEHAAADIGLF